MFSHSTYRLGTIYLCTFDVTVEKDQIHREPRIQTGQKKALQVARVRLIKNTWRQRSVRVASGSQRVNKQLRYFSVKSVYPVFRLLWGNRAVSAVTGGI